MKAIILAAGLGTRLRPITDRVPKCMVPVNGICIIDKQINNLLKGGVNEIIVVAGYKSNILREHLAKYPSVKIIDNIRYAETNNMYSLYLAYQYINDSGFLLMNSDVYFDANIIEGLLAPELNGESLIACDKNGYIEESMKIMINEQGEIKHISKKISELEYYAVSIDIYKLNQRASKILLSQIKDIIEVKKDENSWTEVALDCIFTQCRFMPYSIKGRWFEIDDYNDLHKAEEIFKGDIIGDEA